MKKITYKIIDKSGGHFTITNERRATVCKETGMGFGQGRVAFLKFVRSLERDSGFKTERISNNTNE